MATTTIGWGDGSGDNIYLTYPSASGDQTVTVSSDANSGAARTKTVTFTASGVSPVTLTVNQAAGAPQPVTQTVVLHVSGYIDKTVDGSYHAIANASNAYTVADSSDYAQVNLTRGKNAETYIYWTIDTSSIPSNATIDSVSCMAKLYITNLNSSYVQSAGAKMCSGTTEKTDSVLVSTTAARRTFTMGTWTRAELNDIRLKLYAKRSTSNTSSAYYLRLYGLDLTITYTYTPSV